MMENQDNIDKKDLKDTKEENMQSIIKDILILDINSHYIGFQLEYLREVIDLPDEESTVPIPFTPSYISGIVKIRNEIIPVLSLFEILKIDAKETNCKKLIVVDSGFKVGFLFTDIVDLSGVDTKDIKILKNISKNNEENFITNEFDYDGKRISIIDIYKFFLSSYLK